MSEDLSSRILGRLLDVSLSNGGDFADVFVEETRTTSIGLGEDKIKNVSVSVQHGVSVRVISGDEVRLAYTDELDEDQLLATARAAVSDGDEGTAARQDLVKDKTTERFTVEVPLSEVEASKKAEILRRANLGARDYDRRVNEVSVSYYDQERRIVVANSEGRWVEDGQPLSLLAVSVVAVEGSLRQTGYERVSERRGYELFDEVSPESLGREAAREAVSMLEAEEAPTGELTVVMPRGWGGVLLHEAVGHGLEGDFVRKETSFFTGQMGKRVASPLVTVVDDGTIANHRGSLGVDDEGTPTQRTVLIEKGICTGFLFDLLNARLMGMEPTGNGRRESFRHPPLPRMTNTFMVGGEASSEDLIRETERGLEVRKLGGGQVDITSGNFVFKVNEAYLIEDGKTTRPVKGATLIGNGPEIMKRVDMVAAGETCAAGSCGKGGQMVPVCVGEPGLRISAMTVGGTRS
jgi:TldD protein